MRWRKYSCSHREIAHIDKFHTNNAECNKHLIATKECLMFVYAKKICYESHLSHMHLPQNVRMLKFIPHHTTDHHIPNISPKLLAHGPGPKRILCRREVISWRSTVGVMMNCARCMGCHGCKHCRFNSLCDSLPFDLLVNHSAGPLSIWGDWRRQTDNSAVLQRHKVFIALL